MDQTRMKKLEELGITQEMLDQAGRDSERDAMYLLYKKFEELKELCRGERLYLCFRTCEDAGVMDGNRWWLDWENAEEGILKMEAAIKEIKEDNA